MSFTIESNREHIIWRTGFPRFRHVDFGTLSGTMSYRKVAGSEIIHQEENSCHLGDEEGIVRSNASPAISVEGQLFFDPHTQTHCTRAKLLAMAIKLEHHNPRCILDIGCNRGALLEEFRYCYPRAELHGMDLNPIFKSALEDTSMVFHSSLDEICETFDMVVCSHTMMYVPSLGYLQNRMGSLASPEGILVLIVPNFAATHPQLLLGDQQHYFSEATLLEFCGP